MAGTARPAVPSSRRLETPAEGRDHLGRTHLAPYSTPANASIDEPCGSSPGYRQSRSDRPDIRRTGRGARSGTPAEPRGPSVAGDRRDGWPDADRTGFRYQAAGAHQARRQANLYRAVAPSHSRRARPDPAPAPLG